MESFKDEKKKDLFFFTRVEFFAKMKAVHQFMEEQNLSKSLMERTDTYLSILWRVHR